MKIVHFLLMKSEGWKIYHTCTIIALATISSMLYYAVINYSSFYFCDLLTKYENEIKIFFIFPIFLNLACICKLMLDLIFNINKINVTKHAAQELIKQILHFSIVIWMSYQQNNLDITLQSITAIISMFYLSLLKYICEFGFRMKLLQKIFFHQSYAFTNTISFLISFIYLMKNYPRFTNPNEFDTNQHNLNITDYTLSIVLANIIQGLLLFIYHFITIIQVTCNNSPSNIRKSFFYILYQYIIDYSYLILFLFISVILYKMENPYYIVASAYAIIDLILKFAFKLIFSNKRSARLNLKPESSLQTRKRRKSSNCASENDSMPQEEKFEISKHRGVDLNLAEDDQNDKNKSPQKENQKDEKLENENIKINGNVQERVVNIDKMVEEGKIDEYHDEKPKENVNQSPKKASPKKYSPGSNKKATNKHLAAFKEDDEGNDKFFIDEAEKPDNKHLASPTMASPAPAEKKPPLSPNSILKRRKANLENLSDDENNEKTSNKSVRLNLPAENSPQPKLEQKTSPKKSLEAFKEKDEKSDEFFVDEDDKPKPLVEEKSPLDKYKEKEEKSDEFFVDGDDTIIQIKPNLTENKPKKGLDSFKDKDEKSDDFFGDDDIPKPLNEKKNLKNNQTKPVKSLAAFKDDDDNNGEFFDYENDKPKPLNEKKCNNNQIKPVVSQNKPKNSLDAFKEKDEKNDEFFGDEDDSKLPVKPIVNKDKKSVSKPIKSLDTFKDKDDKNDEFFGDDVKLSTPSKPNLTTTENKPKKSLDSFKDKDEKSDDFFGDEDDDKPADVKKQKPVSLTNVTNSALDKFKDKDEKSDEFFGDDDAKPTATHNKADVKKQKPISVPNTAKSALDKFKDKDEKSDEFFGDEDDKPKQLLNEKKNALDKFKENDEKNDEFFGDEDDDIPKPLSNTQIKEQKPAKAKTLDAFKDDDEASDKFFDDDNKQEMAIKENTKQEIEKPLQKQNEKDIKQDSAAKPQKLEVTNKSNRKSSILPEKEDDIKDSENIQKKTDEKEETNKEIKDAKLSHPKTDNSEKQNDIEAKPADIIKKQDASSNKDHNEKDKATKEDDVKNSENIPQISQPEKENTANTNENEPENRNLEKDEKIEQSRPHVFFPDEPDAKEENSGEEKEEILSPSIQTDQLKIDDQKMQGHAKRFRGPYSNINVVVLANRDSNIRNVFGPSQQVGFLKIGNKNLIDHVLLRIHSFGFDQITLVVNKNDKEIYSDYCMTNFNFDVGVLSADSGKSTCQILRDFPREEKSHILVYPIDLITTFNLTKLVDDHIKSKACATIFATSYQVSPNQLENAPGTGVAISNTGKHFFVLDESDKSKLITLLGDPDALRFDIDLSLKRLDKEDSVASFPDDTDGMEISDQNLEAAKAMIIDASMKLTNAYLISPAGMKFMNDNTDISSIENEFIQRLCSQRAKVININTDEFTLQVQDFVSLYLINQECAKGDVECLIPNAEKIIPQEAKPKEFYFKNGDVTASDKFKYNWFCIFGNGITIGDNTMIVRTCLDDRITIGKSCQIKYSVIYEHAFIGDNVKLDNCIVCQHARVPSGSVIKNCFIAPQFTSSEAVKGEKSILRN